MWLIDWLGDAAEDIGDFVMDLFWLCHWQGVDTVSDAHVQ